MVVSVVMTLLWGARPASGYDPRFTHRWLTRQAARLLVEAYPGRYDELLAHIDAVAAGAQHEDDPILDGDDDPTTMRVMRHFFHGADEHGLQYGGEPFPSSYDWALGLAGDNEWNWQAGLEAYAAGDAEHAYFVLGHMVHLIQDLTVPAHSHLDSHGPPSGDDYESYCTSQMLSEFESRLPLPGPGATIPEFASVRELWRATAAASYWRNMYPGDLSDQEAAAGVLAQMFPDLSWSWFSENWTISAPAVGALGKDFREEKPGWFYFENSEHPAAVDFVDYLPRAPAGSVFGANPDDSTMVEGFARDLIPVAVLHSAALMKIYLDEAHALAPTPPGPDGDPDPESDGPGGCRSSGPPAPIWLLLAAIALCPRRTRCAR